MPARPFGLLYGAPSNVPYPSMNWLQAPGCMFTVNRQWVAGTEDWLVAGRAAGMEALYYADVMEVPTGWSFAGEERELYGGYSSWSAMPDSWFWTGSKATASQRINYGGHYMLNMRPGSPWLVWLLENWLPQIFVRRAGLFDGIFWDVLGNRLWVSVWSGTMTATVDSYAGDGRTEAENWIRGVHWFLDQARQVVGPEPIFIGNNVYNTRNLGSGMPSLPSITGGYPSMQQGGHPALNGCMFEGANGSQHPVATVAATVAGDAIGDAPEGFEWATDAGGRLRFIVLSSRSSSPTDLQAYTGIDAAQIGAAPSGYTSSSQNQVSGTVREARADHLQGWTWTEPGAGGGDTTPPLAPDSLTAGPVDGPDVPLAWSLPTDADRASFTIARKASSWGASENPSAGTAVVQQSPGADGAGSATDTPGDGTWYYKAFTTDAAGNVQRGGPTASATVATTAEEPPDAYADHAHTGAAGDPPDPAVWSDPEDRTPGLAASSTGVQDGAGLLVMSARAAVQGAWGSMIAQRLVRLDLKQAARRALLVELGLGTPAASASASFYLVGPGAGADIGNGLDNVYGHPNWLRCEQLGTTFRVQRNVDGAVSTLYSGPAPSATLYPVWLLIGPEDVAVMVDGATVVPLQPRTPDLVTPFGEAFLYLEAATSDATTGVVARFGGVAMMRATPSQPAAPSLEVTGGETTYTADPAPAEELVDLYRFTLDGEVVATSGAEQATGPELGPGEYALTVQTENPSPFEEA